MTTDIITVWHICTAEKHRQCVTDDLVEIVRKPPAAQEETVVWELHPPQSAIENDKIKWSEAQRWPYQINTK